MEMGSGGSSGLANFPDDLTLLYGRSLLHQIPLIMQKIQSAVDETNTTIQATQRIWPISSAIEKNPQHAPLIQPTSSP